MGRITAERLFPIFLFIHIIYTGHVYGFIVLILVFHNLPDSKSCGFFLSGFLPQIYLFIHKVALKPFTGYLSVIKAYSSVFNKSTGPYYYSRY
jgi:hypothetical protein